MLKYFYSIFWYAKVIFFLLSFRFCQFIIHSNIASRAASYLKILVFQKGFASGMYQTMLWWVPPPPPFYMYILIRKIKMWIWISHLYVNWLKSLIYDSLIKILVFGNGFWLFLSLVSYLFSKFWFLLLLRLMGSWFLKMGACLFLTLLSYITSIFVRDLEKSIPQKKDSGTF